MVEIDAPINHPAGTFSFHYKKRISGEQLFTDPFIFFQIFDRPNVLRLKYNGRSIIYEFSNSILSATYRASIDIDAYVDCEEVIITLVWYKDGIVLYFGRPGEKPINIKGQKVNYQIRGIDRNHIIQFGDEGVKSWDYSFETPGQVVIEPYALEKWENMKRAVQDILSYIEENDYHKEVLLSNMCLVMIVTGYEAYLRTRFIEMYYEKLIEFDYENLFSVILSQREKENKYDIDIREDAENDNVSIVEKLIEKRKIEFQSWELTKRVYNKSYGIKFGGLGIDNSLLSKIKSCVEHRHKIIHVNPTVTVIGEFDGKVENIVFMKKHLLIDIMNQFDLFINKLHLKTIKKDDE
ncbi:MAG: hypothetical protein V2A56_09210 [bacterium]